MQIIDYELKKTSVSLTVKAEDYELVALKQITLTRLQPKVKVAGFRNGKVPVSIVEKNIDQSVLQSEFLEEAISQLYPKAMSVKKLRPIANPEVSIKKFVPFTTLEFTINVEIIGEVKLPDYKKIKKVMPKVNVNTKDINDVLKSLQQRMAEKTDIDRAAKQGDQIWIDFKGTDPKTKEPIKGADGNNYPLILGSDTFIPGFEKELIGLVASDKNTFILTFPKDYGFKALAGKKVEFSVSVIKIQEIKEPNLDDAFATKAGPFKSLEDLKGDIKLQLKQERTRQSIQEFESQIVGDIVKKTKVSIPESLINNQINKLIDEFKQNLIRRGQTYEEFLKQEQKDEESYREELRPRAEANLKASLVLAEIAQLENLNVTTDELDAKIKVLKEQYKDSTMQAELDKPEARSDIRARMLTEKTLEKLKSYATK